MIDHVIVPVDGSDDADRAVAPAAEIARRFDARLALLQAVHPDDVDLARDELSERVGDLGVGDAELILDPLNGPVGALAEAVEARPGAAVCMTTHGRGGIGRALFGSVAEEALREVGVPFVLVGPAHDPSTDVLGPLVVPLDGSHRSESILPVAAKWADALGVGVWIVTVVDPADAERVRAGGDDLAEYAYVERIALSLPDTLASADCEVLHSADPAHAVVEFAAGHGLPLVALATHGRTGVSRVVAGSVTTRIVKEHVGLALVVRTADVGEDG